MVGQRIGQYRILRQVGEGGMGIIYEAEREGIGGRAAIKVLRPEYAVQPDIVARFLNEARAANLIEHPGIVKVFEYSREDSGCTYLAMEYLEGESLEERIRREKHLSEADTIRLGRQIAAALAAAHAKQVIHRDLKPENVIIIPDIEAPKNERTKILDFGIAKLAPEIKGKVRTVTNVMMGTPTYMSPEQCRGSKNITDRTDVYAMGIMLYEMLAGRTPFVCEEPGEYIGMHMLEKPPPLSTFAPEASVAMQRLVDSMLLKDTEARPPMATVAQTLKAMGKLKRELLMLNEFADSADAIPAARSGQSLRPVHITPPPSPSPHPASPAASESLIEKPREHEEHPGKAEAARSSVSMSENLDEDGLIDPQEAKPPTHSALERLHNIFPGISKPWQPGAFAPKTGSHDANSSSRSSFRTAALFIVMGLGTVGLLVLPRLRSGRPTAPQTSGQSTARSASSSNVGRSGPQGQLPEELAALLNEAHVRAEASDLAAALQSARNATSKFDHPDAWSALGQYACMLGNLAIANESKDHLLVDTADNLRARANLDRVCRNHQVIMAPDGRLVLFGRTPATRPVKRSPDGAKPDPAPPSKPTHTPALQMKPVR